MCTYVTENVAVSGSAKGPQGWSSVSRATVYFDHPFHAPFEHSLNIDFAGSTETASSVGASPTAASTRRVAVELSADSARALAHAILATLESAETSLGVTRVTL
jgi:Family of unknown function (DUF6295)